MQDSRNTYVLDLTTSPEEKTYARFGVERDGGESGASTRLVKSCSGHTPQLHAMSASCEQALVFGAAVEPVVACASGQSCPKFLTSLPGDLGTISECRPARFSRGSSISAAAGRCVGVDVAGVSQMRPRVCPDWRHMEITLHSHGLAIQQFATTARRGGDVPHEQLCIRHSITSYSGRTCLVQLGCGPGVLQP